MKQKLRDRLPLPVWRGAMIAIIGVAAYYLFGHLDAIWKVIRKLISVGQPFIFGLVFAYVLNLIMAFFEKNILKWQDKRIAAGKKKKPMAFKTMRVISLCTAFILFLGLVVLFIALVIPQLADSINGIIDNMDSYISSANNVLTNLSNRFHLGDDFLDKIMPSLDDLISKLTGWLSGSVTKIISVTSQVTSTIINVIVGLVVAVYLLLGKETYFAQSKKVMYALLGRKKADRVLEVLTLSNHTFSGFVTGKTIDSLIIGLLCFIGATILRIPYPVLIAIIVGITNVIPFFGPFIGAVPSVIIVFLASPWKALVLAIFIFVLQQFDGNILGPKILGDSTGLPNIWVMFAIVVGGGLFGFVGMIVSVPTFAVIFTLLKNLINRRLRERKLPEQAFVYKTPGILQVEGTDEEIPDPEDDYTGE